MATLVNGSNRPNNNFSSSSNIVNPEVTNVIPSFQDISMGTNSFDFTKWGFTLPDLYKLALKFYKGKIGP